MQVEIVEAAQLVGTFLGIFIMMLMIDVVAIVKDAELPQERGWALVGWVVNKLGWGVLHVGLYVALYAYLMSVLDAQYRTAILAGPDVKEVAILGLFRIDVSRMDYREVWHFQGVSYHLGSIIYGVLSVLFYWLAKSLVDIFTDVVRNWEEWRGVFVQEEQEQVVNDTV